MTQLFCWKLFFLTKRKRCLNRKSNPEISNCKSMLYRFRYPGRQSNGIILFCHRFGRDIWSTTWIALPNKPQETKESLKSGRNVTIVNFPQLVSLRKYYL